MTAHRYEFLGCSDDGETEYSVIARVHGYGVNRPATYWDPPEYREYEIESMTLPNGLTVSGDVLGPILFEDWDIQLQDMQEFVDANERTDRQDYYEYLADHWKDIQAERAERF